MLPHFHRKIFVKASEAFEKEEKKRQNEVIKHKKIKGAEAKAFYESVLNQPSTSKSNLGPKKIKIKIVKDSDSISEEFNVKTSDLFKAAEIDEIEYVQKALDLKPEFLNILDSYGWTLAMIASKAGSVQVLKHLVNLKADLSIKDKAGHDCFSLAVSENVKNILKPKKSPKKSEKSEKFEPTDQSCEICQIEGLTEDQLRTHLTSTVHQIKVHGNNPNPKVHYVIPEANRGFQMMLNSGWESNKGLGPPGKESGKLFPVKTALKRDRHGLGLEKTEKKVTHFEPFDVKSVKKPEKCKSERIERQSTVSKKMELRKKQKDRQLEIDFRRDFL